MWLSHPCALAVGFCFSYGDRQVGRTIEAILAGVYFDEFVHGYPCRGSASRSLRQIQTLDKRMTGFL